MTTSQRFHTITKGLIVKPVGQPVFSELATEGIRSVQHTVSASDLIERLGEAPAYVRLIQAWRDKSKQECTWGSVCISGMYPYEVIDNLIKHLTVTMFKVRTLRAELAHIKAGDSTLKFP